MLISKTLSRPLPRHKSRRPQPSRAWGPVLLMAGLLLAVGNAVTFAETRQPRLKTNQEYIEEVSRETVLDLDNPLAVFEFVLSSLPGKVKVYPTENYFYFSFIHNSLAYAGNIRLDYSDREQGSLHFAYFLEATPWRGNQAITYRKLDAGHGVKVEKLDALSYRVSYKSKEVIFDLNDLSQVRPPDGLLNEGEVYIGPVFDESGLQFFLIFNPSLKVFHYVLNEIARVPEVFYQSKVSQHIIIGNRTSYAFYQDKKIKRKILIGVYEGNTFVNNHFDGPFDQLPDNFIQGETLREAILAILPDYKGKIDRFGALSDGSERYAISPYMYYGFEEDLAFFEDCVAKEEIPYYACFHVVPRDERDEEGRNGQIGGSGKTGGDGQKRGAGTKPDASR